MPIRYAVDYSERRVRSSCYGKMSVDDYRHHIRELWGNPRHMGFNEVIDARDGDFTDFNFIDMLGVLAEVADSSNLLSSSRLAIVVCSERQRVLSDFYLNAKALFGVGKLETRVFENLEEAIAWCSDGIAK